MKNKFIFISGGAGFIGSNVAKYHLDKGDSVLVFDNLSRKGTKLNLSWLKGESKGKNFRFIKGDVTNISQIKKYISGSDVIYHMAAQVAVTKSLTEPVNDFEINARGTLNMLEAYRLKSPKASFIYASTNKVYGALSDIKCVKKNKHYIFSPQKYMEGISENRILDFHSPYGCSKGAGDQYVIDYGRVYGLKTIVFRQSCIYGPRQFGNEDQGWVMHFVRSAVTCKRLNIFGDGCQVRDLLHISDLLRAYQKALEKVRAGEGLFYNIGGGLSNSVSLLEIIEILETKLGCKLEKDFFDWREGDQKVYISDNSKINRDLKWSPKLNVNKGIDNLITWAKEISGK